MKNFISFITPNYNGAEYLEEYFAAFKTLSKEKFEVIFVDDLSTDNSLKIADKWTKKIPLKIIINKTNLGPGFSRNVAFNNIDKKATHFVMVDSDDIVDVNVIKDILELERVDKPLITLKFNKFNRKKNKELKHHILPFAKGCGIPVCWGSIFPIRYSKIKFDSKTFEDFKWMEKATKKDFKYIDYSTINYRIRASSVTKVDKKSRKQLDSLIENIDQFLSEFSDVDSSITNAYIRDLTLLYLYVPKNIRSNVKWPVEIKKTWRFISFLQKIIFFWKIHDYVELHNAYK